MMELYGTVAPEQTLSGCIYIAPNSGTGSSGSTITPSAVTFSLAGTSVTATPGDAVLTESEDT